MKNTTLFWNQVANKKRIAQEEKARIKAEKEEAKRIAQEEKARAKAEKEAVALKAKEDAKQKEMDKKNKAQICDFMRPQCCNVFR